MPGRGQGDLGSPAPVPGVRPRRLLRLQSVQARRRALRRDRASGDALVRTGRDVALVLRRQAVGVRGAAGRSVGCCAVRVLVIGPGAREHAILLALSRDPEVTALACGPGNAGTEALAE